jgi:hypothetical protein
MRRNGMDNIKIYSVGKFHIVLSFIANTYIRNLGLIRGHSSSNPVTKIWYKRTFLTLKVLKRNPLYLKIQFVPCGKRLSSLL